LSDTEHYDAAYTDTSSPWLETRMNSDIALIQARNRFMHAHAPCRGNTYKLTLSVGSACLAEPTSHFFHQVSIAALFTRRRSPPRWRFHRISLGRLFVERWQARQRFTLCEDASCRCRNASAAASWKCCVLHPARTSDKFVVSRDTAVMWQYTLPNGNACCYHCFGLWTGLHRHCLLSTPPTQQQECGKG